MEVNTPVLQAFIKGRHVKLRLRCCVHQRQQIGRATGRTRRGTRQHLAARIGWRCLGMLNVWRDWNITGCESGSYEH
jgi:hypothetical protein